MIWNSVYSGRDAGGFPEGKGFFQTDKLVIESLGGMEIGDRQRNGMGHLFVKIRKCRIEVARVEPKLGFVKFSCK